MMAIDHERMWQEFSALPPDAQQQVLDFIAFLRSQRRPTRSRRRTKRAGNQTDDKFIGMWRDREDMQDSRAWVRSIREDEWTKYQ